MDEGRAYLNFMYLFQIPRHVLNCCKKNTDNSHARS